MFDRPCEVNSVAWSRDAAEAAVSARGSKIASVVEVRALRKGVKKGFVCPHYLRKSPSGVGQILTAGLVECLLRGHGYGGYEWLIEDPQRGESPGSVC